MSLHQYLKQVMDEANEPNESTSTHDESSLGDGALTLPDTSGESVYVDSDEPFGDPAEIIHDVNRVAESHLIANLDTAAVSPPDLNLLSSFADDGLSSSEEILSGNTRQEIPTSLYESLFQNEAATNQSDNIDKLWEDTGGLTTSSIAFSSAATSYQRQYPILARALNAQRVSKTCSRTEATSSNSHIISPASSTHQLTEESPFVEAKNGSLNPQCCAPAYFQTNPNVQNLQNSFSQVGSTPLATNTYLMSIIPQSHYQELLLQPASNVHFIPKTMMWTAANHFAVPDNIQPNSFPSSQNVNQNVAALCSDARVAVGNPETSTLDTTNDRHPLLREQLFSSTENASTYATLVPAYPAWASCQSSQRNPLYNATNNEFATHSDTTRNSSGNIQDSYRRITAADYHTNGVPIQNIMPSYTYPLSPPSSSFPDNLEVSRQRFLNRSPPRYVPTTSGNSVNKSGGVDFYGQYKDEEDSDCQVLDMSFKQNPCATTESEAQNQYAFQSSANQYIANSTTIQQMQTTPGINREYLTPLDFKTTNRSTLCSICFPKQTPVLQTNRPPPPPNSPQTLRATCDNPPRQVNPIPMGKRSQYITVRQMLMERAQKRRSEVSSTYHPSPPNQNPMQSPESTSLPYVRPPAPMSTTTMTMSYPPIQPKPTATTTSHSRLWQSQSTSEQLRPLTCPTVSSGLSPSYCQSSTFNLRNARPQNPAAPFVYVQNSQQIPTYAIPRVRNFMRPQSERMPTEVLSFLQARLMAPVRPSLPGVIPNLPPNPLPSSAPPAYSDRHYIEQVSTAPLDISRKPQLKVTSSYIAVPSSCKFQLPQLFSPNLRYNDSETSDESKAPKHYELDVLKIGSFKVEKQNGTKNINKLKIFFSKRKFVYEVLLENIPLSPNHDSSIPHMAVIDVPFNIVTAIHCNDQEVVVAVCSPPKLFLGCKQNKNGSTSCGGIHFDRNRPTDVTNGQLRTCQIHKLCLKRHQAECLRSHLEGFDSRFSIIMNSPIFKAIAEIEGPLMEMQSASAGGSQIVDQGPPNKRHCIIEVITPDVATKVTASNVVCHCQVSCCSNRCSCMKAKTKCGHTSSGCLCKDCNNPLNLLECIGVNIEDSILDSCLIQGLVSYKGDLNLLLRKKLTFPCCGEQAYVKDCIPGLIKCPNETCKAHHYRFSWCHLLLMDEVLNPRNHCSACKTCKDAIDLHCQACRKCNPVEGNSTKCPFCGAARGVTFTEHVSVSEVLARYRQNKVRNKMADKVIAMPTHGDKNEFLLPKIVERLNEKMKETCVELACIEVENEMEKVDDNKSESNLVIAEEVNNVNFDPQNDVEVYVSPQQIVETSLETEI